MNRTSDKGHCLVVIPARSGSKGIPGKNMALLGGRPLLEFSIHAAVEADLPGRICLSTDDERIRRFGLTFPIDVPFLRPKSLARDDSDTIGVIRHALTWYEREIDFHPEYVVLLQPTSPFRTAGSVGRAFHAIVRTGADCLISVNPVTQHPCECLVADADGFEYVMRPPDKPGRQNFPEVLFINGAIYITRSTFLRETGKIFDHAAHLFTMSTIESIDIDETDDLEFANWMYERHRKTLAL